MALRSPGGHASLQAPSPPLLEVACHPQPGVIFTGPVNPSKLSPPVPGNRAEPAEYHLWVGYKGPVTSLMPSQVNHSPVINHLLLGKKIKPSSKSAKNNLPSHAGGKTLPGPHEDTKAKLNSPWRTHMRVHRKNAARAKGHLGYGDTIGLIEEPREQRGKASSSDTKEEAANKSKTVDGDGTLSAGGPSPEPAYEDNDSRVGVSVVQQKLEALELTPSSRDGAEDEAPNSESPSLANDSGVVAKSCPPKPQVFCPFPSVKPLRKSAAARNLGLYGPNERTPTVHFPQMSRSFNKPTNGNSGSKQR